MALLPTRDRAGAAPDQADCEGPAPRAARRSVCSRLRVALIALAR